MIRLVGRSTVEEIILKRADDKLKLTNTVIEGGQVWQHIQVDVKIPWNSESSDHPYFRF